MKKKQWEPEYAPGHGSEDINGRLQAFYDPYGEEMPPTNPIDVVLMRASDYRKLLRLARKAQTAKRTP